MVVTHRAISIVAKPYVHATLVAFALIVLGSMFGFSSYRAFVLLTLVIYAIAALGLNFPVGFSGVLSVGQGAAFGVGMYAAAILAADHVMPVWIVLPVAMGAGAVVGLLMATPAGRLGGLGLTMVSLGFTIVFSDLATAFESLTHGIIGIAGVEPRWGFDSASGALDDAQLTIVAIGVLAVVYLGHWYFRGSTVGRACVAAKSDALGAEAIGISRYRVQLATFAIGSGIGAVAGALNGYVVTYVSPTSITVALSFLFLVMVVLGGAGSRIGPVVGAAVIGGLPLWLAKYPKVNVIIYGALLVLVVRFRPRGVFSRTAVSSPLAAVQPVAEGQRTPVAAIGPVVVCEHVSKSFGGLRALDDVSLELDSGEVLAIVGPNGSGKTTLLNVLSGFYPCDTGHLVIAGAPASSGGRQLARLAVSRTFQTPRVFADLSPAEHVALAMRRPVRGRADADLARYRAVGLDLADAAGIRLDQTFEARSLSHGQLRFLEVATAILRAPTVLLLDEPASGLSASEIALLSNGVAAVSDLGSGVVLVEHHLELVREVADHVLVLNLGRPIWHGDPGDLHASESVREAYLGASA